MSTLTLTTLLEPRGPAAAIVLDDAQVAALGAGAKTFPVTVTIGDRSAALRLTRRGDANLIGLSRAVRADLGVEPGDDVTVVLERDESVREVAVPDELASALDTAGVRAAFDALAPSRRKEHARAVGSAKKPETRDRRVAAIVGSLTQSGG